MPFPKITIRYFNIEGAAEKVRLTLTLAGVPFEDDRIDREKWPAMKPTTKYGQVPIFEVEGEEGHFAQSGAMMRWAVGLDGADPSVYPKEKVREIEEALGLATDLERTLMPVGYVNMRPEMFGHPKKEDWPEGTHDAKVKELQEGFLNEKMPEMMGYVQKYFLDGKRKFFAGDAPTMADCYWLPLIRRLTNGSMAHIPKDCLGKYPQVAEWQLRMETEVPQIKAWYVAHPAP